MKTNIIAAFPGTGKSYLVRNNKLDRKVVDLDSNAYTQGHDSHGNVASKAFPGNYIQAIKKQIDRTDVLLISIHSEVLDALRKEQIKFTVVYPETELKSEYINRFQQRQDPSEFIELFNKNWQAILERLQNQKGCKHVVLSSGQHLADLKIS
jgi:phosphopantetheine adenylyltransferase